MQHLIFKDPSLNGWEYGMLRSFEAAIAAETGAVTVEIPAYHFTGPQMRHFAQGMQRGKYRRYFPKQGFPVAADTAWYILMGPENYRLDLYKGWEKSCRRKILYLYDTLPAQYPLIQRLFSNDSWDLLITSFNDAAEDLSRLTGRQWLTLEQAADASIFHIVPPQERIIHFSSYGRRYPVLHEVIGNFCAANGLYYDYTTHDAKHPVVDATELYRQYAWHLSHSIFTLSWPVELTNPARAGHLRPITCRWFEAAASGTPILGQAPANPFFEECLSKDLVTNLDPTADSKSIYRQIETIWSQKDHLLAKAAQTAQANDKRWTWNERVQRVLAWI